MSQLTIRCAGVAAFACFLSIVFPATVHAWETEGLRLRGRLQGRWQVENESADSDNWSETFILRRARVDGRWEPENWLRLVAELDLSDGVRPKDAYARLQPHELLGITAGQFKKPFSRLKMSSPFDLVIPERGLLDRFAVASTQYGGYGGRDIGIMLSGTYKGPIKLTYYLGAFNNPLDEESYHRDYVGRLEVRIIKGLILAGNINYKRYEDALRIDSGDGFLVGGDLRWTIDDFRLQLEGAWGDNLGTEDAVAYFVHIAEGNKLVGAHSIVSYRFKLDKSLALIPAFMAEVFNHNLQEGDNTAVRLAAAVNLDILQYIRVVVSAEGVLRKARQTDSPTMIFLQLQLDF